MRRLALLVSLALGCGDGGNGTPDAAPSTDAAVQGNCDVLRTDQCTTNASQPKCSVTDYQGTLAPRCVEQNGSLAAGAKCIRGPVTGIDNCDKGNWCSGLGVPADENGDPAERVCRAFCTDESRCSTGELCLTFLSNPKVGYCLPGGCALFATDCPANTTCVAFNRYDEAQYAGVCSPIGPVAAGGDCSRDDCVANVRCVTEAPGRLICHPYCDSSHGCANNAVCIPFPGMPNSGGYCP